MIKKLIASLFRNESKEKWEEELAKEAHAFGMTLSEINLLQIKAVDIDYLHTHVHNKREYVQYRFDEKYKELQLKGFIGHDTEYLYILKDDVLKLI